MGDLGFRIGEQDFYDRIRSSLPSERTSVVLMEGVTDHQNLLHGSFSYAKIAEMFGLAPQEKKVLHRGGKAATPDPVARCRHADVDTSTFEPLTLRFINAIGIILTNPTASTILRTVCDPASPLQDPDAEKVVMHDILAKRNEHLIAEIDQALQTSQTIVIPWGAMHLPFIESALKKRGFQETHRVDRPVIRFRRNNREVRTRTSTGSESAASSKKP